MPILDTLRDEAPALPAKLAQAARYVVDNADKVALQSMRTTANAAGVTSTTMLRLARQMGHPSYNGFKAAVQTQLVGGGFGARAGALRSGQAQHTLQDEIFDAALANMRTTRAQAGTEISRAAHLIRDARQCFLIGSGALSALAEIMESTGSMVLPNLRVVNRGYAMAAEGMGGIGPGDVAVGFSLNPYARRTLDALFFARDAGAQTIAITDRPSSPLAHGNDVVLYAPSESPHYYPSIVPALAVVEAILATVVAEGDASLVARIHELERLRESSDAHIVHRV